MCLGGCVSLVPKKFLSVFLYSQYKFTASVFNVVIFLNREILQHEVLVAPNLLQIYAHLCFRKQDTAFWNMTYSGSTSRIPISTKSHGLTYQKACLNIKTEYVSCTNKHAHALHDVNESS